jgi:hypothetical protein
LSKKLLRKSALETPEEILEDEIKMKFQAWKLNGTGCIGISRFATVISVSVFLNLYAVSTARLS